MNDDASTQSTRTPSSAPGKWNVSPDGRFCVFIEWLRQDPEKWCRFILKVNDDYYAVGSLSVPTARVFTLSIRK